MPMDSLKKIISINRKLDQRFGNTDPFQIITRLAEETGELAEQVNHFEDTGVKVKKLGRPNKESLANEVQDVIRAAMQIASHYEIEDAVFQSIDKSYEKSQS